MMAGIDTKNADATVAALKVGARSQGRGCQQGTASRPAGLLCRPLCCLKDWRGPRHIAAPTPSCIPSSPHPQTDTVYTLLAPAGVTVVPGSVQVALGAPVPPTTEAAASGASASTSTSAEAGSDGSSSGGGSNGGAIAGAVIGVLAGVAIIGGGAWVSLACCLPECGCGGREVDRSARHLAAGLPRIPRQPTLAPPHPPPQWYVRRRRARAQEDAAITARTSSFNPAFADRPAGVTATGERSVLARRGSARLPACLLRCVRRARSGCSLAGLLPPLCHRPTARPAVTTQRSPTKKQLLQEAADMLEAGRSPLRDSMVVRQQQQ